MVAKLRVVLEHDRDTAEQLFHWLIRSELPGGDMRLYCEEVSRRIAEQWPQATPATCTITYWASNGHFWQWRYTLATFDQTQLLIESLAKDPLMEFGSDDVSRVKRMMQLMEATMDCRDVVGF